MSRSRFAVALVAAALIAATLDAGHVGSLSVRWIPLFSLLGAVALGGLCRKPLRARWWPLCPLLAWFVLFAVYALNPSHRWEPGLGLWPLDPAPGLPASADVPGTIHAGALAVAAVAVFAMGRSIRRADAIAVQWMAVAGGAILAALVVHERMGGAHYMQTAAVFVNVNHFAALMNLLLPVVLVTGIRHQYRAAQKGNPSSPAGLCCLAAGLMALAVWMTGSRMGLAMLGCNVVFWSFMQCRLDRQYGFLNPRSKLWAQGLPALTGALVLSALLALGVLEATRGVRGWGDLQFRAKISADTLAIWRENPWWGTGPGTFTRVFPYYQSEALNRYAVRHAHNDPLQFLAEYGVLGGGWTFLALGWGLWLSRRKNRNHGEAWPQPVELETPAYVFGLATVALHSLVDFPFRAPAILLVAALWLSKARGLRRSAE